MHLPQLMEPTPTISIAPHERKPEQEVPSDGTNERIAHHTSAERETEVWNLGEREGQGAVPERPSAVVPERTRDGGQVEEAAHRAIQSGMPRGECQHISTVISVNIHQFQRETPRTQHLVLPSLPLMQQRNPQRDSTLSRLSWGSLLLFMPRFAWNTVSAVV